MQRNQLKSYLFVAVQFACLLAIAVTGPLLARNLVWLALEAAALALGVWTLWTVRRARFNILPDVVEGAHLVTQGPYRWIRHPMYATLLLGAGALVLDSPTPLRIVLWLVLLVDLLLKLHYEESMLAHRFAEYAGYRQSSKRLVPYVY